MKTAIINGQELTFWDELTVVQFKELPVFLPKDSNSFPTEVPEYYGDYRTPNYSIVDGNPPTVNLKEDGDAVFLYKGSANLTLNNSFLLSRKDGGKEKLVSSTQVRVNMNAPAILHYICVVRKQKVVWGEPCLLHGIFSWIITVNAMREETPKGWVDKDLS